MTIPKLTFSTISFLFFSCGQPENKMVSDKRGSDNAMSKRTEIRADIHLLPDTTVRILWRDSKYDEELKDTFNTIIINQAYCKTAFLLLFNYLWIAR